PDEGAIAAAGSNALDTGRVRILTIHGAKGLEAPVVWLLDAHAAPRAADAWDVLVDWPAEAPAPRHFSFYGRMDERGAARQPLFDAESTAAVREELNLLYVAITRARQVFIASGIAGTRDNENTPYRRLQAALEKLGGGLAHGAELPQAPAAPEAPVVAEASLDAAPLPRIGERRTVADAGERFGILLHALLERRTGKASADGWWRDLGFDDAEYRHVLPPVERLLAAPALRHFFDPAVFARAWNEIDISTSDGTLRRIDRLVEFDGPDAALWVLDYKSSASDTPRLTGYRAQVLDYCQAVAAVFPDRPVHGALIFTDTTLLEVC
ncbi:MAG: 3'-5' exonuclease, partial [Rhodocyclaceae bacterium]